MPDRTIMVRTGVSRVSPASLLTTGHHLARGNSHYASAHLL